MALRHITLISQRLGTFASKTRVTEVCTSTSGWSWVGCRNMSTARTLDISGIFPPIATPFEASEEIAWDKLTENIAKWNEIGFKGYLVQGSNGEVTYLSPEERVQMVKHVRQAAAKDKMIMAGSGCESTRDTISMTAKMAAAGADCVLVVTPCYYKASMTQDAFLHHYTKVADASPVPVILYSVPANTGIDLSADVVVKLSQHPNIIGMKDSAGNVSKLGDMLYRTRDQDFQLLAGSAGFLLPALTLGCVGGVCALANILGTQVCDLVRLHHQGQHQAAVELQQRLIAPNAAVTSVFSVPGLKAGLDWFGYHGGPLRSPLRPLSSDQTQKIKDAFLASGFQP